METLLGIAVGIGLSAACGFRIFVPLLVMNLASLNGLLHLSPGRIHLHRPAGYPGSNPLPRSHRIALYFCHPQSGSVRIGEDKDRREVKDLWWRRWSCGWGDRKIRYAGKRSGWIYRYDSPLPIDQDKASLYSYIHCSENLSTWNSRREPQEYKP